MRCYILVGASPKSVEGGWEQIVRQAQFALNDNPDSILKIYSARGGEKWVRIVAEVTRDGIRLVRGGNRRKVSELLRRKT